MMGERESLKRVKADRRDDVPKFTRHRTGVIHGT
jgi:hypothetical protein